MLFHQFFQLCIISYILYGFYGLIQLADKFRNRLTDALLDASACIDIHFLYGISAVKLFLVESESLDRTRPLQESFRNLIFLLAEFPLPRDRKLVCITVVDSREHFH